MAVIGLDLGGTKLSTAVFSVEGAVLHKVRRPLDDREGPEVGDLIKDLVKMLLSQAEREQTEISAVGICVPGIFRESTGTVWAPNIRGWDDYPLLKDLRSVIDERKTRIIIENDRNCCALGEVWKGNAAGCRNAVFLSFGTGIGAGIVADGCLLKGEDGVAGAIGWMAFDGQYDPKYSTCGNFEYYASGAGIARLAGELLASEKGYQGLLRAKKAEDITSYDVFTLYDLNDIIAVKTVEIALKLWGKAVANIVSVFNPEKIIFGGGLFGPGLKFLDNILAEAKKWAQPVSIARVRLEPSGLDGDAALFGIGSLCLDRSVVAD